MGEKKVRRKRWKGMKERKRVLYRLGEKEVGRKKEGRESEDYTSIFSFSSTSFSSHSSFLPECL